MVPESAARPAGLNRLGFGLLLLAGMAAGTVVATSLGFFASTLIDEFGLTRQRFGLLLTASILVGAAISPLLGRATDRLGGRYTLAAVFGAAASSFLVMSMAPGFGVLFLGALIAAIGMAAPNPATNKLITRHMPPGVRGTVTGVKQSGVQAAAFVSGLTIPWGAATLGWRWTMVLMAAGILVLIPITLRFLPDDRPSRHAATTALRGRLPGSIRWLTVYGLLLGFAGSSVFLVPLFAEEDIAMSTAQAGVVGAVVGLSAFVGRIGWARWAERRLAFGQSLAMIAVISGVASVVMLLASVGLPLLVWVGAVLMGISVQSWNSPGMLAVMVDAGPERAGRASGVVVLGFLGGLGLGPPLFGRTADAATAVGSAYDVMWWLVLATSMVAVVVALAWMRSGDRIVAHSS